MSLIQIQIKFVVAQSRLPFPSVGIQQSLGSELGTLQKLPTDNSSQSCSSRGGE